MILGIDPSLTRTAIVRGDLEHFDVKTFSSPPNGDYAAARMKRYDKFVSHIMAHVGPGPYDAIFIEGYSFGSNGAGARWLTEYGSILRWHLVDLTKRFWEVSPSTLKLFAAGNGGAQKPVVARCLREKYKVGFDTFDEFDAFGLFRIGLVMQRLIEPDGRGQVEAIERLRHPEVKARKVRAGSQRKPPERTLF